MELEDSFYKLTQLIPQTGKTLPLLILITMSMMVGMFSIVYVLANEDVFDAIHVEYAQLIFDGIYWSPVPVGLALGFVVWKYL